MKKYIAVNPTNAQNSGVKTRDEAECWAAKELANKPHVEYITIAEVIGECRRTTPATQFVPLVIEEEKPALLAQAAE